MMKKSEKLHRWLIGEYEPLDEAMCDSLSSAGNEDSDPFLELHKRENIYYNRWQRWSHRRGEKHLEKVYNVMAVLVCIALIVVLVLACMDLPAFGNADALVDTELSRFYVEEGLEHTGAPNIVTGIILEFRGFDTLGESHVLFIAVTLVIMLLYSPRTTKAVRRADSIERHFEPTHDEVLKHGAKIVFPFVVIFGIYVLMNGHLSPGGGFSGGAVLGAGLILILEAYGPGRTEKYLNYNNLRKLMTLALAFYACCKFYVFFTGANGLPNGLSTGTYGRIFSAGLLMPLSLAVGIVVACTMYTLYALFRRKGDL